MILQAELAKKLKVNQYDIKDVTIHKMSIDARNKKMFAYVYDLDVTIDNENKYVGKDVILVENEEVVDYNKPLYIVKPD